MHTKRYENQGCLAEIIDEHNVGIAFIDLGKKHVTAVGRNGETLCEVFIGSEDLPDVPASKMVKADTLRIVLRAKVDSVRPDGPTGFVRNFRHIRNLLGRCARMVERKHHDICVGIAPREVQYLAVGGLDRGAQVLGRSKKSGFASLRRAAVELTTNAFVAAKIDPFSVMRPERTARLVEIGLEFVRHTIGDIDGVHAQVTAGLYHLERNFLRIGRPAGVAGGSLLGNLNQVAAIGVGQPNAPGSRAGGIEGHMNQIFAITLKKLGSRRFATLSLAAFAVLLLCASGARHGLWGPFTKQSPPSAL